MKTIKPISHNNFIVVVALAELEISYKHKKEKIAKEITLIVNRIFEPVQCINLNIALIMVNGITKANNIGISFLVFML